LGFSSCPRFIPAQEIIGDGAAHKMEAFDFIIAGGGSAGCPGQR
jgi:hypothetical protein